MRSASSISDSYDIAIVGGGLTGKMMALTLAHSGYDIALIAPQPVTGKRRDKRTTTIHQAGGRMLSALGIMDKLSDAIAPINTISIAIGPQRPFHSDWLLHWSRDDETMAFVIENHALDSALDDALCDKSGICFYDDSITSYEDAGSAAHLVTKTGQKIHAALVIACDGTTSQMRAMAGMTPQIEDTGQTALIATIRCALSHDNTAYQRFLPTGPVALMPMVGQSASVVWSTSTSQAEALLGDDITAFDDALNAAFGDELGRLSSDGALSSFALRPHYNRRLAKGRLILAGDAAHAIHPLAGMGYNLALSDAAVLLDVLIHAKQTGLAADHPTIAASYHRRRMPEILAISTLTKRLNNLLSRPTGLISQTLAIGMSVLDKTPLKDRISDIAMGGRLSSAPLLQGRLR